MTMPDSQRQSLKLGLIKYEYDINFKTDYFHFISPGENIIGMIRPFKLGKWYLCKFNIAIFT